MTSAYLASVALGFAALQMYDAAAISLQYDPYTTCTSYDINNKNFPGRGSDIDDDGTCTVTVPNDPSQPKPTGRKLEVDSNDDLMKLEKFFGTKMETQLENLPTSVVHTPTPWNTRLWLMYEDSFNFQWDEGQPSATEKYARAFGLDVKTFMDGLSAKTGIDSFFNVTDACTSDNDCHWASCGIRANATSGYCIPQWYGFSHAWAPAALLSRNPNPP
ncbi:unnamed protein product [Phytophthora lilii]|uniref:Unnamed protein product n=1 Tax=Phytophthora lilii TaxID=2077276 RepID=A0A9W6TAA8_9STRA|nr:unnamed protein product [Phytophthora lilii]